MSRYKECPFCHAHLDYGERCECDGHDQPEIEIAQRPNFRPPIPPFRRWSEMNDLAVQRAWQEYDMR